MTAAFIADVRRCAGKSAGQVRFARLLGSNYGLQAMFVYRLGRWLLRTERRYYLWPLLPLGWPLYYLLSRYIRAAFGIRLDLSADIGPGFYIGHFGAIHIRRCHIGANCSIGSMTDIAPAANGPGPVIGDRVWIGAHVRIIGKYRIGSGATVGAGTVVRSDVPDRALYLGTLARVVMRNYDNSPIL